MPKRTQWPNQEMWEQAVEWRRGGATFGEIEAKLSRSEYRKQFGLEAVPSEDTIRRHVMKRLAEESSEVVAGRVRERGTAPASVGAAAHQAQLFGLVRRTHQVIGTGLWSHSGSLAGRSGPEEWRRREDSGNVREVEVGPCLPPDAQNDSELPLHLRQARFAAAAVLTLSPGQPPALRLREEGSSLWEALREHLPGGECWERIERWKAACVEELEAVWSLNEVVKREAEQAFDLPVLVTPVAGEGRVAQAIFRTVRSDLVRRARGDASERWLSYQRGSLNTAESAYLTEGLKVEGLRDARACYQAVVRGAGASCEAAAMIERHRETAERAAPAALQSLEEVSLYQEIPGGCRFCRG